LCVISCSFDRLSSLLKNTVVANKKATTTQPTHLIPTPTTNAKKHTATTNNDNNKQSIPTPSTPINNHQSPSITTNQQINLQMPTEVKPLFGIGGGGKKKKKTSGDGDGNGDKNEGGGGVPTLNSVYFFKISTHTARCMAKIDERCNKKFTRKEKGGGGAAATATNEKHGGKEENGEEVPAAVKLLHKFFVNLHDDATYSGRFKAIGIGFNFEEVIMMM
jgi:hypothetical protein